MKKKIICGLLACAIFVSVAALPMVAYAADAGTAPATTPVTTAEDGLWHVSDNMLTVLKAMEGFAATPYYDYKQWSIGYGSHCPDSMVTHYQQNPISYEDAEKLLREELTGFEQKVNQFIKENNLQHITQNRYDALVSCTYNIGDGWMTDPDGNLRKGVLSGDGGSYLAYTMMLWSTAGGQYILLPRRIREAYMYVRGEYTSTAASKYDDEYFRYVFMDANGGKVNYYVHGFYTPDPSEIRTKITSAPTGPDESGAIVTYVLDGWYTERVGGTKVELLDGSMASGSVLYAHWKTPSGTPVDIDNKNSGLNLKVTVTSNGVNVRTGPQTYFRSVRKANSGDELIINELSVVGSRTWGRSGDEWICLIDSGGEHYTNLNDCFPITGTVKSNDVYVRYGPGENKPIAGTKYIGDKVTITRLVSDGEQMWGELDGAFYIPMSAVSLPGDEPVKATVTFKMDDGSLISETQYALGAEVTPPQVSAKPGEGDDVYVFAGWDKEVTACTGDAVYTATFNLERRVGDINKDGVINDQDAIYLLRHVWFSSLYPFNGTKDLNVDGNVDDQDAIYLLRHVWFADMYPLPQ